MTTPFVPHAVIIPERSCPSPILAVALTGVDRWLRIEFQDPQRPLGFVREALAAVRGPLRGSPFGLATGFVINYREDYAVRFDLQGNPLEVYSEPHRSGQASLRMGSRDLAPLLKPGD